MHRKLLLLALLLAAVVVTGCTGGSGGSGTLGLVTVSGTLQYEGDLDETVVTVGLNEYVTTTEFELTAAAGHTAETQSSELLWEAHYELQVPQGEYTFWLSGYGIAANTQELSVTGNQTVNAGLISKIGLAATGTFYHVGQYAEIYLDIWDDSFDSATFNIVDSSFSQSLPALRDYDTIEVPLNQVETGKSIFVEVQANGQTYYFPAFFIDAPNAINFSRDETIYLRTRSVGQKRRMRRIIVLVSPSVPVTGPRILGSSTTVESFTFLIIHFSTPNQVPVRHLAQLHCGPIST